MDLENQNARQLLLKKASIWAGSTCAADAQANEIV